ncbi:hypothetical protein [Leptospira broomii]|nr:hypothetical protein [Leptospira broomii]
MQTMLSDDDSVEFFAYLNLQYAPKQVFDYISDQKEKDYESLLLDKKGSLSEGLQDGKSFLRIYSRNGSLIHKEYFTAVDDSTVSRLFEFVKKDRLKGRK